VTVVHVTHFNNLSWDCGATPTTVIEHGIPEPAARWTGDLTRLAVVTNEPVRRWRVTGRISFERFVPVAPVDAYGIGVAGLRGVAVGVTVHEDPTQAAMAVPGPWRPRDTASRASSPTGTACSPRP